MINIFYLIAIQREKIQQVFNKGIARLAHESVTGALVFDELRARYALGEHPRILRRNKRVISAGRNQRGILNFRQAFVGVGYSASYKLTQRICVADGGPQTPLLKPLREVRIRLKEIFIKH